MSSLKDIYWMAAPLAAKVRVDYNKSLDETQGSGKGFRLPSKAKGQLRKFYHWALEIDGTCYEVSPNEKCQGLGIFLDLCVPKPCPAEEWHTRYVGVEPETRKIGQTRKTKEEIVERIDDIWINWNQGRYDFLIQNCQNFVKMVFTEICISVDDPNITKEEKSTWKKIPDPVGHRLAEGSQATLMAGTMYGTHTAYLAALASVAEAGQAGGLVAAGATATTIEGAAAGTAIAAEGGAGAGAAGTAGTSQAAGAVAAKGTAAGTTGATKVGLSAKLATLGHAGAHGAGAAKAASIGGGMLKVGGTFMWVHPVAGATIAGAGAGLVYVATRGKRDKDWKGNSIVSEEDVADETVGVVDEKILEDAVEATTDDLFQMEADLLEQLEDSPEVDGSLEEKSQHPAEKQEGSEPLEQTKSLNSAATADDAITPGGIRGKIRRWRSYVNSTQERSDSDVVDEEKPHSPKEIEVQMEDLEITESRETCESEVKADDVETAGGIRGKMRRWRSYAK